LLNFWGGATATSTEWRTVINILLLAIGWFWGNFIFLNGIILRLVDAWNCGEHHNVKG